MSKNYFEIKYNGPYKGIDVSLPEDMIQPNASPFLTNFILKNGEIRTRPRQKSDIIQPPPDRLPVLIITSFLDANNIFHTVAVTGTGLWQLNRLWRKYPTKAWSLVGQFPLLLGPGTPINSSTFVNKFFFTNGGTNLWYWDGITSIGQPNIWVAANAYKQGDTIRDSNGNLQVASNPGFSKTGTHPIWSTGLGTNTTDSGTTPITWVNNGKPAPANGFSAAAVVDATNGITAGSFFLIELNAQLLMLNTVESAGGNFAQRIRWCASGMPTIWDPNVNIGAGFNDELDVPDAITGAFTAGTTGFILRNNGITEVTANGSSGTNPFNFNHLWASDRGIGNIFPYGYASYGPLGVFISEDDIYNVSLGGFERVGGIARDAIYNDLGNASGTPIAAIVPFYTLKYVYNHYKLAIPMGNDTVIWNYSFEDKSWQREYKVSFVYTGVPRWSYTG